MLAREAYRAIWFTRPKAIRNSSEDVLLHTCDNSWYVSRPSRCILFPCPFTCSSALSKCIFRYFLVYVSYILSQVLHTCHRFPPTSSRDSIPGSQWPFRPYSPSWPLKLTQTCPLPIRTPCSDGAQRLEQCSLQYGTGGAGGWSTASAHPSTWEGRT